MLGKKEVKGVEIQVDFLITENFTLILLMMKKKQLIFSKKKIEDIIYIMF
jgi:hypothetical protein